jgi:hypothetical protein
VRMWGGEWVNGGGSDLLPRLDARYTLWRRVGLRDKEDPYILH